MRRSNNRDDRRRRVLSDERVMSSDRDPLEKVDTTQAGPTPRYSDAARIDQQPRVCDFLPIRPWTLFLWFLVGTTFVVGHATLFAVEKIYGMHAGIDLTPMRLTGPQTLSSWSSSFLLMVSAMIAAIIVQFRRHRINDYRGEYRIWYYFVLALVVASINASVGGHQIAWHATHQATESLDISHAGIWINGLISVFISCVGIRLLLEIRDSRGTVLTGLFTGLVYGFSWLIALDIIPVVTADLTVLSAGMARLMAHFLLMMTLVVYARYVFLDAQGKINHTAVKKSSQKRTANSKNKTAKTKPPKVASTKARTPTQAAVPAAKTASLAPSASEESDEDLELSDEESPSTLKLSKAERRRLRKQKRRDQRAA
ncbi:MAG: hypothetical protein GY768_02525 [Planctomycetaceae bacterium]|nr:hypothetical protein [Planctomycetaceae bacterium]